MANLAKVLLLNLPVMLLSRPRHHQYSKPTPSAAADGLPSANVLSTASFEAEGLLADLLADVAASQDQFVRLPHKKEGTKSSWRSHSGNKFADFHPGRATKPHLQKLRQKVFHDQKLRRKLRHLQTARYKGNHFFFY